MEKKKYVKPSMEVYEMEMTRLVCASDGGGGGGMTYLPYPGSVEEET